MRNLFHNRTQPVAARVVVSVLIAAVAAVAATRWRKARQATTESMTGDRGPVHDDSSPADRLAASEEAVTSRTPDPLRS